MSKLFDFPLFTPGPRRSNNGTLVNFDETLLRDLARNTRFVLGKRLMHPPVGFRHPAKNDHFAKGHIVDAQLINGVVHAYVAQPKFIADAKAGNLLDFSGEFGEVEYTDNGQAKKVFPCIVGIGLLGDERAGVKDERKRTLPLLVEEQAFGESLTPAQTWEIAEELRKTGLVSQTFAEDGTYCFSEIQIDPQIFTEERKPMTAEELQQITNTINAAVAPIKADLDGVKTSITTMKTETDTKLQQFSEQAKTENKIAEIEDRIRKEKKLGLSAMKNFGKALRERTVESIEAFAESLSPAAVQLGEQHGEEGGGKKEPAALAKLRVSDFAEPSKFDSQINAGLLAFAEAEPTKWSVVADKPHAAKLDALKTHIAQRDASAN